MPNRYLNLFKLPERLYTNGSPIIIETGALHKDSILGDVVAQLKFRSLVAQKVVSVSVDITCFNAANEIITSSFNYKYTNIIVNENEQFFAHKTLITLPDNATRSFNVKVNEVEFSDGSTVLIDDSKWTSLPNQTEITSYGNVFIKYFKQRYRNTASVLPIEHADLWICTCGQENNKEKENCSKCNNKYSEIFPFDVENEKKNAIYELAKKQMADSLYDKAIDSFKVIVDWKDSKELIEKCEQNIEEIKAKEEAEHLERERKAEIERKEAEHIAKRNKKIAIITAAIVYSIIAFIIILYTVIIPNSKYNDAIKLINTGDCDSAYSILIDLDRNSLINTVEGYNLLLAKAIETKNYKIVCYIYFIEKTSVSIPKEHSKEFAQFVLKNYAITTIYNPKGEVNTMLELLNLADDFDPKYIESLQKFEEILSSYDTHDTLYDFMQDDSSKLKELWSCESIRNWLLSDYNITYFMIGYWKAESGTEYLNFYKNNGSVSCKYTLPTPNITHDYYDIVEERMIFEKKSANGNTEKVADVFQFTFLSANKVECYCYKNGQTYILTRT